MPRYEPYCQPSDWEYPLETKHTHTSYTHTNIYYTPSNLDTHTDIVMVFSSYFGAMSLSWILQSNHKRVFSGVGLHFQYTPPIHEQSYRACLQQVSCKPKEHLQDSIAGVLVGMAEPVLVLACLCLKPCLESSGSCLQSPLWRYWSDFPYQ